MGQSRVHVEQGDTARAIDQQAGRFHQSGELLLVGEVDRNQDLIEHRASSTHHFVGQPEHDLREDHA